MHKLLNIKEEYVRDYGMHYNGAVWCDTRDSSFMLIREIEERPKGEIRIHFVNSKKEMDTKTTTKEEVNEHFKAVSLSDGYINLNGYCLYAERVIDGKYKKTTTMQNTAVTPLGTLYVRVNNKRVKRELDAYTCMKALRNIRYTFPEAVKLLREDRMFSVAITTNIALLKQPVKAGDDKIHAVYLGVYLGEVKDECIDFVDDKIKALVIEQLQENGYAA